MHVACFGSTWDADRRRRKRWRHGSDRRVSAFDGWWEWRRQIHWCLEVEAMQVSPSKDSATWSKVDRSWIWRRFGGKFWQSWPTTWIVRRRMTCVQAGLSETIEQRSGKYSTDLKEERRKWQWMVDIGSWPLLIPYALSYPPNSSASSALFIFDPIIWPAYPIFRSLHVATTVIVLSLPTHSQ